MNTFHRTAWICRCVWRLRRRYARHTPLPGGRILSWDGHQRLIQHILSEYRED